ncbi:hypothetical protein M1349_01890 [Patescibacteria group bacterium]|nr:hypothetical protein [Patescibacteria group bacterium]
MRELIKPSTHRSGFKVSSFEESVMRKGRIIGDRETPDDMVNRVVEALVSVEDSFSTPLKQQRTLQDRLGSALIGREIVFSTPIMTNAGRHFERPLSACSVPPVNLRGDLNLVKKVIGEYHQQGMGTGFNFNEVENPVFTLRFFK